MGSPLIGRILIEETAHKTTTIVLDGDKATVVAGSPGGISALPPPLPPGHDGHVSVNDSVGTECGTLSASGVGGFDAQRRRFARWNACRVDQRHL